MYYVLIGIVFLYFIATRPQLSTKSIFDAVLLPLSIGLVAIVGPYALTSHWSLGVGTAAIRGITSGILFVFITVVLATTFITDLIARFQ